MSLLTFARERHLEKQRIAEAADKNLKRTTKLTSGNAFKRHEVCLTSPSILEAQLEYEKYKAEQRDAALQRKKQYLLKTKVKVDRIREKDESKWSVADYRTLLTYEKQPPGDDPTLKISDRDVLKNMWQQRQIRTSPVLSPAQEPDNEYKLDVEAAAAALAADPLLNLPIMPTEEEDDGYI